MLIDNEKSISFAKGKSEEEIRNLNEFIGYDENPLLQTDDIIAFNNVASFINELCEFIDNNSYIDGEIYDYFCEKLHKDNILLKSFK